MSTVSDVPLGLVFAFAAFAIVGGIIAFMNSHLKNQAVLRWVDAVVELCKAIPATPAEVAPRQEELMTLIERLKRLEQPDLSPGSRLVTSRMLDADIPRQLSAATPLFNEVWANVWKFYCTGGLDPEPLIGTHSRTRQLLHRFEQMQVAFG